MSPVYERAYEAWEGERTPRWRRVATIAGEGLRASIRSKWVWALLAVTLVHVAIRAAVLYVSGQVDLGQQAPAQIRDQISFNEGFIASALATQARWVLMLLLALVAAPALARDLQAGALSFYFSKPITRTGYAVGKILPAFVLGLTVTVVPGLVLWGLGAAFTPEAVYPDTVGSMPLRIIASGTLVSLVASLIPVALSGLTRSTNLAAVGWVALAFLSAGAAELLHAVTGRASLQLVDVFGAFDEVNRQILAAPGTDAPDGIAWLVTAGWALVSIAVIGWVLSGEEVTGS